MPEFGELFRSDDWKKEKHVPVMDCPDKVAAGETFEVRAMVGKEVAHPNETRHHIRWIALYFLPEGGRIPIQLGQFEFTAHGESAQAPDQGPAHTHHGVTVALRLTASGALLATAYCNIHGVWQSSKVIAVG